MNTFQAGAVTADINLNDHPAVAAMSRVINGMHEMAGQFSVFEELPAMLVKKIQAAHASNELALSLKMMSNNIADAANWAARVRAYHEANREKILAWQRACYRKNCGW